MARKRAATLEKQKQEREGAGPRRRQERKEQERQRREQEDQAAMQDAGGAGRGTGRRPSSQRRTATVSYPDWYYGGLGYATGRLVPGRGVPGRGRGPGEENGSPVGGERLAEGGQKGRRAGGGSGRESRGSEKPRGARSGDGPPMSRRAACVRRPAKENAPACLNIIGACRAGKDQVPAGGDHGSLTDTVLLASAGHRAPPDELGARRAHAPATALVHEAYMRAAERSLRGPRGPEYLHAASRGHAPDPQSSTPGRAVASSAAAGCSGPRWTPSRCSRPGRRRRRCLRLRWRLERLVEARAARGGRGEAAVLCGALAAGGVPGLWVSSERTVSNDGPYARAWLAQTMNSQEVPWRTGRGSLS
jgi:hypothetical protein